MWAALALTCATCAASVAAQALPGGAPKGAEAATAAAPASAASSGARPAATSFSPLSAAVAARFPDPAVVYRTPGLEPGREAWTDNTALASALQALVDGVAVRRIEAGRAGSGAALEALHFARGPAARPRVLVIGQQHGNEPAGAEAALVVARQLADPRHALSAVLDRVEVLILPRANPDGAALGRRANAVGLDINRDHLLLRTPEAEALARLARDWRPVVVIDLHEFQARSRYLATLGLVKRHDLLVQYAGTPNLPPALSVLAESAFRAPLLQALAREGLSVDWYFTTPAPPAPPAGPPPAPQLSMGGHQPALARNAGGLRHAVSFLLESRGLDLGRQHAQRRVHAHVVALHSLLASAAAQADALQALQATLDAEVSALACRGEIVLEAVPAAERREMTLLDEATGADRSVLLGWESTLRLQTTAARPRPCGYVLPAEATDVADRLRRLGLVVRTLPERVSLRVERAAERVDEPVTDATRAPVDGAPGRSKRAGLSWQPESWTAPAGSHYIGLDQALAHLAVAALEPDAAGSWWSQGLLPRVDTALRVMAPPPR